MQRYLQQLRAWYGSLEGGQRIQLWVAVALAAAALVAVGWWSTAETWRPLATGRTYEDLVTMAAALDAEEIPYRIQDNGSLLVPDDQVGKAKAAVAAADLTPSLQDVSDLKMGLTPRAQEWAFLRAREGDLARMINGIAEINASHVSIVPREDSIYFGEERPASASVFLRMRPGASLSQGQVQAIANLVANAVDGLDTSAISVADDRGNLLADGSGGKGMSGSPDDIVDYRASLERRYERSVSLALLPILGSTQAFSVTATVDLDLTSTETVSKRVDVNSQAVLSEQMDESSSNRSEPGGIPGVDANLPERADAAAAASQGAAQNTSRSSSTFNYVYPTIDEIRRMPAGGVQRVSTAVQVDQAKLQAMVQAGAVDDLPAVQAAIEKAVQAAVGFDKDRGDVASVSFLPFAEREWVEEAEALPVAATTIVDTVPWGVAALALALVFWFVVRPVMARVTGTVVPPGRQLTGGEEDEGEPVESDPDAELAQRLHNMVTNFQPVDSGDLNRLVEHQAVAAANVVRQWSKGA